MRVCGIDPGKKGGLAFVDNYSTSVHVMPVYEGSIADLLEFHKPHHVFLEKSQSFPGQGIASAFNYGRHSGLLEGVLMALEIPYTLVPPIAWTKDLHAGIAGTDPKRKSLTAACRLFPGVELVPDGCRKPHEGIIDALLIAEYGRRKLGVLPTAV